MIATAVSWSISVARSHGLPSILTAIAALASPGPIAAANSAPVNGAGNSRRLPSGRVTATGCPGRGGAVIIRSEFSLIAPYTPSKSAVRAGRNGHEKTPSVARRGSFGSSSVAGSARTTSGSPAMRDGSRRDAGQARSAHTPEYREPPLLRQGAPPDVIRLPTRPTAPALLQRCLRAAGTAAPRTHRSCGRTSALGCIPLRHAHGSTPRKPRGRRDR